MAVQVSQDFKKIARQITCVMKNRFKKDFKSMKQIKKANASKRKKGKKPRSFDIVINRAVSERYGASDQMRYLNEFAIAPVGYIKMRIPMKKALIVNKYTVDGRVSIHKNLKMDLSVVRRLMENPVLNRTIQYADNRISRFIAQYGKCSVTNILLRYEEVHCHHKKLRSVGADDSYENLVIIHKDIHRLIHATDKETILKYVRQYGESINFSKLNQLRKAVGNSDIDNNVLDNPNEEYWILKHFDDRTIDHIQNRFDEESGTALINTWKRLCEEAAVLQESGAAPESEKGQAVASEWWDMVKDFTGGDMSLLPELIKFSENRDGWDEGWKAKQASADIFIQKAMSVYFTNLGYNPFEGANHDQDE